LRKRKRHKAGPAQFLAETELDPLYAFFLLAFWQLLHSTHAAGTDMDCARCTIHYHMATLYIEYKAAASAPLRETHIIAVHRLALTNITTTSHIYSFLI